MEFTRTQDLLLKLLHPCPPYRSQQIINLMAVKNWPAQYVRHNFYRGAAGRAFFSACMYSAKPFSAGGGRTVHCHSCPHHPVWVRRLLYD